MMKCKSKKLKKVISLIMVCAISVGSVLASSKVRSYANEIEEENTQIQDLIVSSETENLEDGSEKNKTVFSDGSIYETIRNEKEVLVTSYTEDGKITSKFSLNIDDEQVVTKGKKTTVKFMPVFGIVVNLSAKDTRRLMKVWDGCATIAEVVSKITMWIPCLTSVAGAAELLAVAFKFGSTYLQMITGFMKQGKGVTVRSGPVLTVLPF